MSADVFTPPSPVAAVPAASRAPRRVRAPLLLLPATLVLVVLFLAPLAIFTVYAFFTGGDYEVTHTLTLQNFRDALSDPVARQLTGTAFVVGGFTGVISLLIGVPLGYVIRYRAGRLEYVLLFAVVLGMFASYLGRIYAWRTILGDNGPLDQALGSVGLPPASSLLFTRAAVVIALVHIYVPYVVLVAYAAFRNVPAALFELARDLGAGPVRRWIRVVLPLIAPAAVTAFLYTFVLSASDYVTPQFLGGTKGNMVGLLIEQQFTQFGNYPYGAALSLVLLALFLAVYGLLAGLLRAAGLHRVARSF